MKVKNVHICGYETCAFSMKRKNAPWKVRDGCENPLRLFTGKYYALPYSSACTTCPYYCRDENILDGERKKIMDLHMKQFDGTTFGMSVETSSPAFKRMKKNAFTGVVRPHGSWIERTARCVRAVDVVAVMGQAGWLVSEQQCMETIRWGNDETEYYIIYEKGNKK